MFSIWNESSHTCQLGRTDDVLPIMDFVKHFPEHLALDLVPSLLQDEFSPVVGIEGYHEDCLLSFGPVKQNGNTAGSSRVVVCYSDVSTWLCHLTYLRNCYSPLLQ